MHLLDCGLEEALWAIDHQPQLLRGLADYRLAEAAIAAMNHPVKAQGFKILNDSPELQRILLHMTRAQRGDDLDAPHGGAQVADAELAAVANAYRSVDDGDPS